MLKLLIISILFWVHVASQTEKHIKDNEDLKEKFEQFIVEYSRQYKDDNEKAYRFTHFVNNVRIAEELNKKYGEGQFGITKFSDWSKNESKRLHGLKPAKYDKTEGLIPLHKFNKGPAPAAWDWRHHNAVTPVKYQGTCGSCWIFSAIENIEGQYALKHKKLVSLSEQQIVDCIHMKNGLNGCYGGYPHYVFEYLTKYGELVETEAAYRYIAKGQQCKYNQQNGIAKVLGYNYINATTDDELKQALYEYGPLSFGMNADTLNLFIGKIFPGCSNNQPDHGMLIVGYGSTDAGEDYWIVKNSWGADWNGDGYFKMKRGINICKILQVGQIITSQVA